MVDDQLNMRLIERDEYIPVASFITCLENTLSLLKDLQGTVSEDSRLQVKWALSNLSMNSPASVSMFPITTSGNGIGRDVVVPLTEGLRIIEQGSNVIPPFFTARMLDTTKKLAHVLSDGIKEIQYYTAFTNPVTITLQAAVNAEKLMGREYRDYASFEGTIEVLSVHDGLKFNLYDDVYGRIECRYDESSEVFGDINKLTVRDVFSGRVLVTGTAKYSRTGQPSSMKVDKIIRLRSQSDLPQLHSLNDIDLTNGVESSEYVRTLREAEYDEILSNADGNLRLLG